MKTIVVTQEEINKATRPNVYRNRKKIEKNTLEKINTGISLLKINLYIDS